MLRFALLSLALVASASLVSSASLETSSWDNYGATSSNYLCVGNKTVAQTVKLGECQGNGAYAYYCDSSLIYQVVYNTSASTTCEWSAAKAVGVSPQGCGVVAGYVSRNCVNMTDAPALPWGSTFPPTGFSSLVRSANYENNYNATADHHVVHQGSQTCADTPYYTAGTAKIVTVDPCKKLTGAQSGYSAQSIGCDSTNNYAAMYDNDRCTGNIVTISQTVFTPKAAECNKDTGISGGAVTCASPSTPASPSYAVNDGQMFARRLDYNDNGCKSANLTSASWLSNGCASGSAKYVCSNTTAYPVLTRWDYETANVDNCNTNNYQNVTIDTTCQDSFSTSYQWSCVTATGGNGHNAASSMSVSFVAMFIAAFVAMVARQ